MFECAQANIAHGELSAERVCVQLGHMKSGLENGLLKQRQLVNGQCVSVPLRMWMASRRLATIPENVQKANREVLGVIRAQAQRGVLGPVGAQALVNVPPKHMMGNATQTVSHRGTTQASNEGFSIASVCVCVMWTVVLVCICFTIGNQMSDQSKSRSWEKGSCTILKSSFGTDWTYQLYIVRAEVNLTTPQPRTVPGLRVCQFAWCASAWKASALPFESNLVVGDTRDCWFDPHDIHRAKLSNSSAAFWVLFMWLIVGIIACVALCLVCAFGISCLAD